MSTVTRRKRVPVPRDRENDYTRELSLGSPIVAEERLEAHDIYGRSWP